MGNEYNELLKKKNEVDSKIEEVKENLLLRSKEKEVNNLQKLRESDEFWTNAHVEGVGRYNSWVDNYTKEKKALEEEKAKLSKNFFSSFINSSKIKELEKEIKRLEELIKKQEENVREQEIKLERDKMIHNISYNKNDIWNFLKERNLTEESYKEKIQTIPDYETLSETLRNLEKEKEELEREIKSVNIQMDEQGMQKPIPTATPEDLDRIISSYVKEDNNTNISPIKLSKPESQVYESDGIIFTSKEEYDKHMLIYHGVDNENEEEKERSL